MSADRTTDMIDPPSAAAARAFPAPEVLAISAYPTPSGLGYFEYGAQDRTDDVAWLRPALRRHGVGDGNVLALAPLQETVWFDPVLTAVRELGSPYSMTDNYTFDAFRNLVYIRQLGVRVMLGLTGQVAEALGEDLAEVVASVPTILARPDACEIVEQAGGRPFVFTPVGPALAVECPERAGAHVNGEIWDVAVDVDGEVRLTTVGRRLHHVSDLWTGVAAQVRRGECGCGESGPRLVLEPPRLTHPR